jgi:hypothetical protein
MSRRLVFALPFALVALAPATSLAADDCPDGWFCEDSGAPQAPPPGMPPRGTLPPRERPRPQEPPPGPPPGYGPPSYPPPGYEPIHFDAPDNPPPVKRRRGPYREWGFNLHLEAALIGNKPEKADNAGMAGLGFGFRYRPIPHLAFEAGLDFLTGTDFQGYSRSEAGLLLNTLVFFNPHDVVQLYGLGGLGFSRATVTLDPRAGDTFQRHDEDYSYFGGQLGLGVEVRVTRRIALSGDIVGFIRGRTDDRSDREPEFIDPNTHRATNTSGGGLLRVGASFYW